MPPAAHAVDRNRFRVRRTGQLGAAFALLVPFAFQASTDRGAQPKSLCCLQQTPEALDVRSTGQNSQSCRSSST